MKSWVMISSVCSLTNGYTLLYNISSDLHTIEDTANTIMMCSTFVCSPVHSRVWNICQVSPYSTKLDKVELTQNLVEYPLTIAGGW